MSSEFLGCVWLWVFHVLNFLWQLFQSLLQYPFHLRFSAISCILLVILTSVIPNLFPRFSIYGFAYICVFFTVPTSTFRSWITISNTFPCLPVFLCISVSELLIKSSPKDSIIIMRYDFRSAFWFPGDLFRACCGGRTWFWWCPHILASVAYGHVLAWYHLDISGVCWSGVCLLCPGVSSGLLVGLKFFL